MTVGEDLPSRGECDAVGEPSWSESVADVVAQLDALREAAANLPPEDTATLAMTREVMAISRRIALMTYALERSTSSDHRAWAEGVRAEMWGERRMEGQHRYTSDELKVRARVS